MYIKTTIVLLGLSIASMKCIAQAAKKELVIKRTTAAIKIDGDLSDSAWATAPLATNFVERNPTPFKPEDPANATQMYLLYSDEGIYIGGYFHESNVDSIAKELTGRDGFGNNDFAGIIFDTYDDQLNGFEYFVTPLGEQWDSKMSYGNSEDFAWNSVWESKSKLQKDGWSFEVFLPYSAIRFGKKKVQDWGMNLIRRRQKAAQQLFWQPVDQNINGFLSQEGTLKNLENIKPPLRLQFSPYLSTYINNDGATDKTTTQVNGGMDVKYGISPAFTLDMTLIPDFGQVVSDNRILNLTPFEQKFSENRAFFTEGTELFNKGNLFYSRRIGDSEPIHFYDAYDATGTNESISKNPRGSKLINATKISGRTQKGLGIGILNAITKPQYATIINSVNKEERKFETNPLTNYNVFVLDQTLKYNSSVSFVNTNTWRSGSDYDANVSSFLIDLNDKTNTWNVGGNVSVSNLIGINNKTITGYAHSVYFGKRSGHFTFNIWQNLINAKYEKSDLGYFTNNNTMDQGIWLSYNWNKPTKWYNQVNVALDTWHGRLVSPIDVLKRKEMMYQNTGFSLDGKAQLKNLWWVGITLNGAIKENDFYEPRVYGRFFKNTPRMGLNLWWESNNAKKLSFYGNVFNAGGNVFNRRTRELGLGGKIRFNSKFSLDHFVYITRHRNQQGWAYTGYTGTNDPLADTIIFSRRTVNTTENILSMKYSINNRMGITFRARHYWSKVDPKQFYQLNTDGNFETPAVPFTKNVNQNYNYFSVDMVYNWQFAQGSFFSVVWKDIAETFDRKLDSYGKNFSNTISSPQFNSLSLRVIYFLDYLTLKNRKKKTV
ncbi:DUF5916 domain-containing protein [Ferruginibacter sp. SUN002]|uniref:DUF5916 domain-containing protein n=1 Tax=Ferruginibacter sp. SUN002 TaxID=2937789 RepID=UPI003D3633B0